MEFDDPDKPEFSSWLSFHNFAYGLRYDRRYVWDKTVEKFLDTVVATAKKRDTKIGKGAIYFRAQRGVERPDPFGIDVQAPPLDGPTGFGPERMKPRKNRATEGRANPLGIPVLYVASTMETAISEVRPWIGSDVSVAEFRILRDLKVVDLSIGHNEPWSSLMNPKIIYGESVASAETKEAVVWNHIDNAFSAPVAISDDTADYVPTQILAECFKSEGYDGIIYGSQFGSGGSNVAMFDTEDAEPINSQPAQVTEVSIGFDSIGEKTEFPRSIGKKKKPKVRVSSINLGS